MSEYQHLFTNWGRTTRTVRLTLGIAISSILAYNLGACDSTTSPGSSWSCSVTVMGGEPNGDGFGEWIHSGCGPASGADGRVFPAWTNWPLASSSWW